MPKLSFWVRDSSVVQDVTVSSVIAKARGLKTEKGSFICGKEWTGLPFVQEGFLGRGRDLGFANLEKSGTLGAGCWQEALLLATYLFSLSICPRLVP